MMDLVLYEKVTVIYLGMYSRYRNIIRVVGVYNKIEDDE